MGDSNGSWDVGGKRVLRYEDFDAQRRAERERHLERLRESERRYFEAQREYSESLRAVGPAHPDGVAYMETAPAPSVAAAAAATAAEAAPRDELTDHNYDGIQEYDNPTPGWWWWIFAGTVAYSVFHVALVHFTPDTVWKLPEARHAAVEAAALEKRFAELNKIPMGEAKILKIMNQESWLDQGASIFKGTCAVCHGREGQGLIGPNLTDEVYLTRNVTELGDIPEVIRNGSANGQMPPQKNFLKENEIALVSAYVAALRGTELPEDVGAKAPEGEPIDPWPTLNEQGEVVPASGGAGGTEMTSIGG